MAQQIQIRRDIAANWTSANPILAQGELGLETNTNKIKIGNGTSNWNSLTYFGGAGALASLTDVSISSLASGQVILSNSSSQFINLSLSSLIQELAFASLGSLSVMNQLSYGSILNTPSLGSLAVINQLSFTSLLNQPSLSSLAFQSTVDYVTQVTSKPSLGSLAVLNDYSYTSLLNLPSLGSLAVLNSLTKSDVGLGNVTNDAQLKIASNLSDLNNVTTARGNLSLGSLAVLNSVTAVLPSTASFDIVITNSLRASSASIGTLSFTSISTPSTIPHNSLGGLTTGDPHTQYFYMNGRAGGQYLFGGTAAGEDLFIDGTNNSTVGDVFIGYGGGRTLIGPSATFNGAESLKVFKSTVTSAGQTGAVFVHNKTVAGGFNYGIFNNVEVNVTTGTTDSVQGFFNYVNNDNAGTINFVEAFTQRIDNLGTGAIGDAANIKIFTPTSNGTISNLYGIYIEDQNGTGIVNGYSIYSLGGVMYHDGQIRVGDGSVTVPTYSFNNDRNTGMYSYGADVIGFTSNGTIAMIIDNNRRISVNNIGGTAQADIRQTSTTAAIPTMRLEQTDYSEEFIQFQSVISTSYPIVQNSTATTFSHKIRISVNGTFKWLYAYNA